MSNNELLHLKCDKCNVPFSIKKGTFIHKKTHLSVKTFVFIAVSIAAVVLAEDISVVIVLILGCPLIIATFIAGMDYINSNGRKNVSSVLSKDFNRQKYVASNFPVYSVCNMNTSLDERKIYRYKYSRMGL